MEKALKLVKPSIARPVWCKDWSGNTLLQFTTGTDMVEQPDAVFTVCSVHPTTIY